MTTNILRVDASARLEGSVSRDLNDHIVTRFRAGGPVSVTESDLAATGLPMLDADWIGLATRAGVTFAHSENGQKGLPTGKRVIVTVASGGTEVGSDIDFATGYARHVLGFMGITDVVFVSADRLALDAEGTIRKARKEIETLGLAA